jgi:hypothetical protein
MFVPFNQFLLTINDGEYNIDNLNYYVVKKNYEGVIINNWRITLTKGC